MTLFAIALTKGTLSPVLVLAWTFLAFVALTLIVAYARHVWTDESYWWELDVEQLIAEAQVTERLVRKAQKAELNTPSARQAMCVKLDKLVLNVTEPQIEASEDLDAGWVLSVADALALCEEMIELCTPQAEVLELNCPGANTQRLAAL